MVEKDSKRLVIDASVARACGGKDATYPTSVHCRDFLEEVLTICHKVVMTPDIREEWDKHQSRFAREWLRRMIARKKLVPLEDQPLDRELWEFAENLAKTDKQRGAMVKDLCLLEAALVTDKTVVSLDDNTARRFFAEAATQMTRLQGIVWVNPDKEEEQPIQWLKAGAPTEEQRYLESFKF